MAPATNITELYATGKSAFQYYPSEAAAIIFAVLFGLSSIAHITQAIIYRNKYCWTIILAATWECAGFSLRVPCHDQINSLGLVIPQQILIILAPLWINAFDYMLLARLINIFIYNKKCLGIPARRLSMIFILSDVASFLVQAAGACMLSSTDENSIKLGTHILMGGLGLQLVSMTVFTFVSLRFYKSVKSSDPGSTTRWRTLLFLLWLSLILITIRIIYRFLEFSKGIYSVYEAKEGYFYGLEALPMLFAVMEFNFYHPGRVMPGGLGEFEKKEKKKGRKGKKGEKNLDLDVESGISGDDGLLEGGQGRDQGRGDGI